MSRIVSNPARDLKNMKIDHVEREGRKERRKEDRKEPYTEEHYKIQNKNFFFTVGHAFFAYTSMSEEVTYADLKFQDSNKTENIQKLDKFGNKGKILIYGCVIRWYKWYISAP
nr:C-type lectin domain family 12 member A isoform X2 [Microcebus murinus]